MVQYEWRLRIMARVEELANQVQRLNRDELAAFRDWFRKYDSDEWDREIEQDVLAGRLERPANEAIAEHKAGRTKEL
jgi:KaiC/GvpD/RAD55 family RecA-like ATPase